MNHHLATIESPFAMINESRRLAGGRSWSFLQSVLSRVPFAFLAGATLLWGLAGPAASLERGHSHPGLQARDPGFSSRLRPGLPEPSGVSQTGVVRGYDGMTIDRAPDSFAPRREILRVPVPRQY